jgi:FMN phosphatase YigB (HAD superfamily)
MNLSKKVVLLDYDGVVLRNQMANSVVAKRASLFTRNVMSIHNKQIVPLKSSEELCFNLYKGYGHTLLGLQAMGPQMSSVTLHQYNSFVYSHIDYDDIVANNNDMEDIKQLNIFCQQKSIPIYMFSNSPKYWIQNTLKGKKDLLCGITDVRVLLGVHENDERMLKPQTHIYDIIEKQFQDTQIIFVDDSACNFNCTLQKKEWTNILFCGFNSEINKKMFYINSMDKVKDIIN